MQRKRLKESTVKPEKHMYTQIYTLQLSVVPSLETVVP